MDIQKLETLPPPPGVFGSLKAGFDVVSNHVVLIFLPLALDLLLWLGPRFSVDGLLTPYFRFVFEQAQRNIASSELGGFIQNQSIILEYIRNYNLLSMLSKLQFFPVGISSLSAQVLPVENPFGIQTVVIVSSVWIMLGLAVVLVPFGWIGGGVYYRLVAGSILGEERAGGGFLRAVFQTVLLSVIWLIVLMVVFIPLSVLISLITLVSPLAANIVVLIILFFSFWFIVPFFFTPHGIFVFKQNAFSSIYSSLRMIRFSLPTSGMFVLSFFLLSRGLDLLWSVPDNNSWLMLVGFTGHAFITTALLAGSFVYYRDMMNWLQYISTRFQQINKRPASKV